MSAWANQWANSKTVTPKPGDWTCLNCQETVFAHKDACRACGTPKGKPAHGGKYPMKPGDWICPKCQHTNFSRRSECHRCGQSVVGAQRMDMKPGDWVCIGCGDLVFADKNACRMCGTERDWKEKLAEGAKTPAPATSSAAQPQPPAPVDPDQAMLAVIESMGATNKGATWGGGGGAATATPAVTGCGSWGAGAAKSASGNALEMLGSSWAQTAMMKMIAEQGAINGATMGMAAGLQDAAAVAAQGMASYGYGGGASADTFSIGANDNPMCKTHGKRRSYSALTEHADGTFSCMVGKECKGSGDHTSSGKVELGPDKVMCKTHNKPRGVLNCDEQTDGTHICKRGQECSMGETDANERVKCSVHGAFRSRRSVCDNGDGNYFCWPGQECRSNPMAIAAWKQKSLSAPY